MIMEPPRSIVVCKGVFFLILLIIFFYFFFLQVVVQYLEKYTDTTKIVERVETIEAPTMTICTGWKKSLMEHYKITTLAFVRRPSIETNVPINLTVKSLFDEVTYKLNKDFSISVSNTLSHPIPLNIGINTIKEEGEHVQSYLVKENLSVKNGKCYVIIPNELKMKPLEDMWSITIARNITSEGKDMNKIFIQISAKDTFNTLNFKMTGVTNQIMEQVFTEENNGYIEIEYTEQNMEFIKECSEDAFFRCYAKQIMKTSEFNCSRKCIPVYAQSVMENIYHEIPQCSNNDEEYCMVGVKKHKKWMKLKSACLKQCKNKVAILDMERKSANPIYPIGNVQFDMYLYVAPEKVSIQEYLIYDGCAMFGSIGGSLGLFIGFSLFDSLCLVLAYVLKICNYQ